MSILRSFARDWARWSKAEREAAVVFVVVALVSTKRATVRLSDLPGGAPSAPSNSSRIAYEVGSSGISIDSAGRIVAPVPSLKEVGYGHKIY
ncbi:hypothetical protein [Azospirillum argentinense]